MAPLLAKEPDQNFESQSLLLLPVPSEPWTRSSLRTACRPSLTKVFTDINNTHKGKSAIQRIEIAAVLPSTFHGLHSRRSTLFPSLQKLLEELYTLVCSIAAAESIELDLLGGLDVRIFFLADVYAPNATSIATPLHFNGPLIDLPTLVGSDRSYNTLFAVESETGEACLKAFLALHSSKSQDVRKVPGGTSISTSSNETQETPPSQPSSRPPHHSIAVGGTFDHLHLGHKLLLTATALALDPSSHGQLTIGITGDALLVNKKYASHVESWETRQDRTASFLESILAFPSAGAAIRNEKHIDNPGPNGKLVQVTLGSVLTINYVQISDPFGPTITDEAISALVISKETRAGGKAVNDKRAEKGWAELEVFEVDVLDAEPGNGEEEEGQPAKETFESKISSTELRRRIAEKEGMT